MATTLSVCIIDLSNHLHNLDDCEHGNKSSSSVRVEKILDELSDYRLFNKACPFDLFECRTNA
jgi:hypothetical protein